MRMLVRFGKNARLRFISHLDLQRFYQRALNRTGLPIAFSQGFNPHPVMSFASALAMGWTSEYEVVDVKLAVPIGRGRAEAALRAALPEDLPVLQVKMIDDRHPAPMAQVRAADYRVSIDDPDGRAEILGQIPGFLAEETVMALRKTKSGEKSVNIRPWALELRTEGEALLARLTLTEKDTLKPDLLLRALAERARIEVPEARIHRLCLLGADEDGNLEELMAL